jgi:hypothetical protein
LRPQQYVILRRRLTQHRSRRIRRTARRGCRRKTPTWQRLTNASEGLELPRRRRSNEFGAYAEVLRGFESEIWSGTVE